MWATLLRLDSHDPAVLQSYTSGTQIRSRKTHLDPMEDPRVECHSGSTYAERPKALFWEGERLPILEIEASWRIPGGRCFRVQTEDLRVFELHYNDHLDEWRIRIP
jgi:hypothetical protein